MQCVKSIYEYSSGDSEDDWGSKERKWHDGVKEMGLQSNV